MASRFDRKVADAMALEHRLIEEGRHMDAQIVSRLRRGALSVRGTLKILHRDNMELRQRLGMPSFLDDRRQDG